MKASERLNPGVGLDPEGQLASWLLFMAAKKHSKRGFLAQVLKCWWWGGGRHGLGKTAFLTANLL